MEDLWMERGVRWVNVYVRTREGNLSDRSKLRQSRCWNTDERHVNQSCWSWSYSVGNSTFTKHMISNNRHDAFIFCSVAICLPACLDQLVTTENFCLYRSVSFRPVNVPIKWNWCDQMWKSWIKSSLLLNKFCFHRWWEENA